MKPFFNRAITVVALIGLSTGCSDSGPGGFPPVTSPATTPQAPTTPATPAAPAPRGEYTISLAQVGSPAIIRLTSGEQPAWSPDGGRIAFVSRRAGAGEIYVMKRDGTDLTQLTRGSGEYGVAFLTWSPDGSRIAFRTAEGGLGTVNSDGSNQLTLVPSSSRITLTAYDHPAWSPDGQKILFAGWACDAQACRSSEIYVIDRDGSKLLALTGRGSMDYEPCWSPDGSRIAFVGRDSAAFNLYVMNADGRMATQLTSGWRDVELSSTAWSPDGSSIAFESYGVWGSGTGALEVVRADGTGRRRLTDVIVDEATWSPDGRTLLGTTYDRGSRDADGNYRASLVVIPVSGAAPQTVTDGYNGDWSPDGAWIVFASAR